MVAALLAPGALFAQTSSTTTPVGYITHDIAGAGANPSASSIIAPTLVRAADFAGSSTVSPSGGAVITFAGGVPTGLDDASVLEITSGASEGWWSTIVSSTSTTITIADNFPGSLPANTMVSVRKHTTLESFLGFNTIGLSTFNGSDPSDEILVFDAASQTSISYAFITANDWGDLDNYPNGVWLNLVSSEPENDKVILPGTAVLVKRILSGSLSFVSSGTVKTTKTDIDIYTGFNLVGSTIAALGTLGSHNFAPQIFQWDGSNTNYDELQILLPTQSTVPYASIEDGGPVMWNIAASDYANAIAFDAGTGVIFQRSENPASTITLPGTTITP